MKGKQLFVRQLCQLTMAGTIVLMIAIAVFFVMYTGEKMILLCAGVLICLALAGMLLLIQIFAKRLTEYTNELCQTLDEMMNEEIEPEEFYDSETLSARIHHRFLRLYDILRESRCRADAERRELQMLVSDISHQVKTPVANLKMVTDTLLSGVVGEQERTEFLQGIRDQTEKLEFLFQALVKTSRLETGAIRMEKKERHLFDTLASACSEIVYQAEKKEIRVTVDCPENLSLSHDSRWTAEAFFNLLDNAVKYTPTGGYIKVTVVQWEMYVKVDIADNGRGIPESEQAAVFRRFYRGAEVHETEGVGIGLYLTREIITKQDGYMKVKSEPGKGSVFSVFLPIR